jgi:hypothetical protein
MRVRQPLVKGSLRRVAPAPKSIARRVQARARTIRRGPLSRSYDRFFFVVGIGGSGTQWCAHTFTTGESYCFHDASLALNTGGKRELTHFRMLADPSQLDAGWRRQIVADGAFRPMFERMADRREPRVGTSDEFVGFFADALHQLHPSWRFVLVVRDGVKSTARGLRTWPWPAYQSVDHVWVPDWEELSPFERACHRWRDRNRRIRERLEAIPASNARVTTLERLTSDLDELRSLWQWLGLSGWERYAERNAELQRTPISKHPESRTLKDAGAIWSGWTPEQRSTFIRICGEDMELYGFPIPSAVQSG